MRPTKPANESVSTPVRASSEAFVWTALPANLVVPAQLSIAELYRQAYETAREQISTDAARRAARRTTIHLN